VQSQVLRLVRQRIDVRPRVLGHDDDSRRTGARFGRATCVMAVQKIVEARLVSRVRWRPGIAKLFEIEDTG
jgi:hypothetical protein